ncbi:hypothetical protein, partial [Polaromonas eurypsychrophila]
HHLQLEARVKYSSFRFRHFYYPGDLHLSMCTNSLDQDNAKHATFFQLTAAGKATMVRISPTSP